MKRILVLMSGAVAAVLVPFFLWEEALTRVAAQVVSKAAPEGAVFTAVAALLAGDIVLPVPASFVSASAGALLGFQAGLAAIWIGMTAGCALGYALGRFAGGFVRRRLLKPGDMERMRDAFARSGGWALAMSRPVPVLAEVVILAAGVARAPFRTVLGLSAAANLAVAAVYAAAGALAYSAESLALYIAAGLGLPWAARALFRRSGRKKAPTKQSERPAGPKTTF